MRKLKANAIGLIFGAVLLTWLAVSTAEVFVANTSEKPYEYCKANAWVLITTERCEMRVVDCCPVDDYYEVVVVDIKGDEYAYYSDSPETISEIVTVVIIDDEIVWVR